jgi:predicted RNA-binding Zn-ribbon protein involved in translation (DUF1610 family)
VAAHDAGVEVTCPACGQTVLQKAMIPILADDGKGIRYVCPACARALIKPPTPAADDGLPEEDAAEAEADSAVEGSPGLVG